MYYVAQASLEPTEIHLLPSGVLTLKAHTSCRLRLHPRWSREGGLGAEGSPVWVPLWSSLPVPSGRSYIDSGSPRSKSSLSRSKSEHGRESTERPLQYCLQADCNMNPQAARDPRSEILDRRRVTGSGSGPCLCTKRSAELYLQQLGQIFKYKWYKH